MPPPAVGCFINFEMKQFFHRGDQTVEIHFNFNDKADKRRIICKK